MRVRPTASSTAGMIHSAMLPLASESKRSISSLSSLIISASTPPAAAIRITVNTAMPRYGRK